MEGVSTLVRDDALSRRDINESIALIEGWAELLLEADGALDAEVERAAFESIRRNAARLKEIFRRA